MKGYELDDEQTVKKAIKETLRNGMIFVPCKSCGETWFIPGNLKNIMNNDFICIRCQIKKQWQLEEDSLNDYRTSY